MTEQITFIDKLSDDERAALESRLLFRRKTHRPSQSIPPASAAGPLPLSYAQQRLWFIQALEPANTAYNVVSAVRIRGPLDVAALRQAVDDVTARHQTLRATFPAIARTPSVTINDSEAPRLDVIQTTAPTADGREAEALALLEEAANRPFDLATGPIFRPLLIAINPTDHVFLPAIHHIACDEWSMRNLHREIDEAYRARSAGITPDLPALPIQYADYALWQRKQLETGAYDRAQSYWNAMLAGAPIDFTLPYDKHRLADRDTVGRRHRWLIPSDLAKKIDQLGRETETTPFVTMLAAFMALLHGRTGAEDVIVGTPTAGRERPELEHLIGYFSNILILRTDVKANPTFRDFLVQVRARVLDGMTHQDLPFEKNIEIQNPKRRTGGDPIFRILFTHRQDFALPLTSRSLQTSKIETNREQAKCDLWLSSIDQADGRRVTLAYNAALFHDSTIEALARDFQRLLEAIVLRPDAPLALLWNGLFNKADGSSNTPPALSDTSAAPGQSIAAPLFEPCSDPLSETRMLAIWRHVLGRPDITIHDNFFDLGGHSMLALQLLAEIDDRFGIELPLASLFQAPTVAALARTLGAIDPATSKGINDRFVYPVTGSGDGPPLFFCGIDLTLARPSLWTAPCPLYAVANWAMGSGFIKSKSLKTLAESHVASIRQVQPQGPYLLGGYCHGALVAMEIAHQLKADGQEIELLFLLDPMVGTQVSPMAEETTPSAAASATLIGRLHNRLTRKLNMIGEGPRDRGWKKWLLLFVPFSFEPIVNRAKYFLVERYLRAPNATSRRLRYQAIWGSFWFATERMFKGYAARPYDGATLVVFSNSHRRREFWKNLIGPESEVRSLDFHHYALFQKPAVAEWAGWLSASIRARR